MNQIMLQHLDPAGTGRLHLEVRLVKKARVLTMALRSLQRLQLRRPYRDLEAKTLALCSSDFSRMKNATETVLTKTHLHGNSGNLKTPLERMKNPLLFPNT